MANAFECDLCEGLESGVPLGKSTFEVTDPDSASRQKLEEEWCVECLTSFSVWRESRFPNAHQDDEDEDGQDAHA